MTTFVLQSGWLPLFVLVFIFVCIMARFSASDFKSSVKSILGRGLVLPFAVTLGCECTDPEYAGHFFDIASVVRKKNGQIFLMDVVGNQFTPEEMRPVDLQIILGIMKNADMDRIHVY